MNWVGLRSSESCPPDEGTLLPSLMGVCGAQGLAEKYYIVVVADGYVFKQIHPIRNLDCSQATLA